VGLYVKRAANHLCLQKDMRRQVAALVVTPEVGVKKTRSCEGKMTRNANAIEGTANMKRAERISKKSESEGDAENNKKNLPTCQKPFADQERRCRRWPRRGKKSLNRGPELLGHAIRPRYDELKSRSVPANTGGCSRQKLQINQSHGVIRWKTRDMCFDEALGVRLRGAGSLIKGQPRVTSVNPPGGGGGNHGVGAQTNRYGEG